MQNEFTAVFRKVPEGYIGFVEEIPGANSQGETLEEVRANLEEAVRLVLEANRLLAEEELAAMQNELISMLRQKSRLASLGLAVSKINHDLRNMLSSAQLISDRLTASADPMVQKSVPKLTLVAPPRNGGAISTRTFIPHRCHSSIGVLGAVSVATACLLPGSPAAALANVWEDGQRRALSIEHPTGEMTVLATLDDSGAVVSAAILRTARKLFDGMVFG